MVPLRSPVCDKVIGVRVAKDAVYFQGGFDVDHELKGPLFVVLLARLPDGNLGFDPYLDHRFGLIVRLAGPEGNYERVGIIDGPVLQKRPQTLARVMSRTLERLLPRENRTLQNWAPREFWPGTPLGDDDKEMPPDPLPQIKHELADITLV
jgi:hypothetical protein